ncbi:hypothetical protein Rhopal_006092-T1 [Rhodotorula paludigena]|uniref:Uncharacterized protein n=1 Tax=Rhodotorula paludigena TaxID=86838 RepID=A0AAV5GU68_9BASI|nr:hypothetical protein Rhopal_006092-T1 [Rhodotorula paludigena]
MATARTLLHSPPSRLPSPPLSDKSSLLSFDSAPPSPSDVDPASPYTRPPPGALVFAQHVHRCPPKMTFTERSKVWYAGLLSETLEAWESLLLHFLLLALFALVYLALSRLLAPAVLARLETRVRFYLFGAGSHAQAQAQAHALDWAQA